MTLHVACALKFELFEVSEHNVNLQLLPMWQVPPTYQYDYINILYFFVTYLLVNSNDLLRSFVSPMIGNNNCCARTKIKLS